MQRTDGRPRSSDVVAAMVTTLTGSTIGGWLMYRGSYVAAFLIMLSVAAVDTVITTSRWDWAVVLRHGGDERQRRVSDRAVRIAFVVLLGTALVGASVEMGTGGDPGPFAFLSGVAVSAYLVSVAVLVRRS